jgi:hypothetical protein
MDWYNLTIVAIASLLLWRDLSAGRIYYANRRGFYDRKKKFFLVKELSPGTYKLILAGVVICCLMGLTLALAPLYFDKHAPESENYSLLSILVTAALMVYSIDGLLGRLFSWVKNYGSIDTEW